MCYSVREARERGAVLDAAAGGEERESGEHEGGGEAAEGELHERAARAEKRRLDDDPFEFDRAREEVGQIEANAAGVIERCGNREGGAGSFGFSVNERPHGLVGWRSKERENVERALGFGVGADEFETDVTDGFCDGRQIDDEERIAAGAGEELVGFVPVDVVNVGEFDGLGGDGEGGLGPTNEAADGGEGEEEDGEAEGVHKV